MKDRNADSIVGIRARAVRAKRRAAAIVLLLAGMLGAALGQEPDRTIRRAVADLSDQNRHAVALNQQRSLELVEEGSALEQRDNLPAAIARYEAAQQINPNDALAARIEDLRNQMEAERQPQQRALREEERERQEQPRQPRAGGDEAILLFGEWVLIDVKDTEEDLMIFQLTEHSGGVQLLNDGYGRSRLHYDRIWHNSTIGYDAEGSPILANIPVAYSFSVGYHWHEPPARMQTSEKWNTSNEIRFEHISGKGSIKSEKIKTYRWLPSDQLPVGNRWTATREPVHSYYVSVTTQILQGKGFQGARLHPQLGTASLRPNASLIERGQVYPVSYASYNIIPEPAGLWVEGRGRDVGHKSKLDNILESAGQPGRTIILETRFDIRSYRRPDFSTGFDRYYGYRHTRKRTYEFQGNPMPAPGIEDDDSTGFLALLAAILALIATLPLPATVGQAAAGVVIPGLIALLLNALAHKAGAATAEAAAIGGGAANGTSYVFDDGRSYREGGTYTFDDGVEYQVIDGDFKPLRTLAEGARYTNPDGDRKIFIGGQPWFASDWARQEATTATYLETHLHDSESYWDKRRNELEASREQRKAEDELIEKMQRMRQVASRQGMTSGKDDTVGRISGLIDDLIDGKPLDPDHLMRVQNHVAGRITGRTLGPRDLPASQIPVWADFDSLQEALVESGRQLSTGQSSDGSSSWHGIGGRIAIGALSGGASEWAFVPAGSAYTIKDAIDRGESGLMAAAQGIGQAVIQDLIGRGVGATFRAGGTAAKGAYKGGVRGAGTSAWGSLKNSAAGFKQQFTEATSIKGWNATFGKLGRNISEGVSRADNILTGKEGLIKSMPSSLTPAEQARVDLFNQAVNSGDPERVSVLYRNRGMRHLDQLQRKGAISPEAARKANRMMQQQVNDAIRKGTRDVIESQNTHGVRIEEVIIGDSGSSAGGKLTRIATDADRTIIPRFNETQLKKYALRHKISPDEAYNRLSREFTEKQSRSVDYFLRRKCLTSADVDYSAFDRIGTRSGHCDSYSSGFTNARQATGRAEVYRTKADGTVHKPYRTSGHSAVDANQLNNAQYGTTNIAQKPTAFTPNEVPSVVCQQLKCVTDNAGDPIAIAKAVGRTEKAANILQQTLHDPDLLKAAQEIYNNPGTLEDVLTHYGFNSIEEFCEAGSHAVTEYANM